MGREEGGGGGLENRDGLGRGMGEEGWRGRRK